MTLLLKFATSATYREVCVLTHLPKIPMKSLLSKFVVSLAFVAATTAALFGAQEKPTPVRTDWEVQKTLQISGNRPVYPPLAANAHIEGSVRMGFVVAADGSTKDILVISGHPLLVQSAMDAVRSWRFKPTIVQGSSVEVETTASVSFFLPGHDTSTYLASFREDVRKHPDQVKAHDSLAHQLQRLGQVDEAILEYRTAISLQHDDASGHFGLGQALGEKGDVDAAIREYRLGISMKPRDIGGAHYDLAGWLEKKGALDDAVVEYRSGLQLTPKDGSSHYNFALLLMRAGDVDAAVAEYQQALRYDFDVPEAHFRLGQALEQKGELAAALKEYQKAIRESPNNSKFRQAHDDLAKKIKP